MAFIAELKRRNVIRMAGLYLVGAWLVVQVASTLLPMFQAPEWAARAVVILLAAGFLPAMLFSWVYELTPDGLKRESEIDRSASITQTTGQRIEHAMVVVLAVALAFFAFDRFVLVPREKAALHRAADLEVAKARREGGAEVLQKAYGDRSIAVLPFVNMSSDPEQEYFADGISEELLNQLAKIQGLRVIARTSSFSFKGKDADIRTIADALNVAHLLEGSVRRSGNKLRVSAKLIRTTDGAEMWAETYDRDLADVFAVQDDIASAVVAQLKLKLLAGAPSSTVVDPNAYALFLQARSLRSLRTDPALHESASLLKRALAIEPGFAEAWSQLGVVYRNLTDGGALANVEGYELARQAQEKALSLRPGLPGAHAELVALALGNTDLAEGARHVSLAAASAPEDPAVLRMAAAIARYLGRNDESIAYAEAVVARDPNNPTAYSLLGSSYYFAGKNDEAVATLRHGLALSPGLATANNALSYALLAKGDAQGALAAVEQEPGPWRLIGLATVEHALGRRAESDAALGGLVGGWPRDAAFNIAYIHAYRGETDQAFEWLEKAVQYKDPGLADTAMHPLLANLHQDARWLPLLRKLRMAPEQLSAIKLDVPLPGKDARLAKD